MRFLQTIVAIAATVACGGVTLYAQVAAAKPAEEVYKNIVQLKGTPADQLMPAMQFISSSLGVQCDFCHVQGKMEADDKGAKRTAREMMAMQAAINKEVFPRPVAGDVLLLPPGSAAAGEYAAGAGFGCGRAGRRLPRRRCKGPPR